MTDIDRHIETYRQEAEELLSDIEMTVLDLEQNPDDRESLNRLFRAMHTIKGSGAMFGFDDVAGFSHHVENVLDQVRAGKLPVTARLIDLILASRDHIKALLAASEIDTPVDRRVGEKIVSELAAYSGRLNFSPASDRFSADPYGNGEYPSAYEGRKKERTYRIRFRLDPGVMKTGMDPLLLLDELSEMGDCFTSCQTENVPTLEELVPDDCYFFWDTTLTTTMTVEDIRDAFIFVEDTSDINIREIDDYIATDSEQDVPRLGEILVDRGDLDHDNVRRALTSQRRLGQVLVDLGSVSEEKIHSALNEQQILARKKAARMASSVRITSEKLDQLINLVGEMVITQAHLSQILSNLDDIEESGQYDASSVLGQLVAELGNPVENMERLTSELRDCALGMRMLPIGSIFGRFRRLVRDLSAELGKEVELVTNGAETEMDKTVIERLNDPLIHLIRNSIDHGIQLPEQREKRGKPAKGMIRLSAAHKGANVVITIEDDGVGIDSHKIIKKAVKRGFVSEDAELSENDVLSLLFLPGFSTADRITEVSGRGVGMDVVKREIDRLGGSIQVNSVKNESMKITLYLPLTLAIIDGLMIRVHDNLYVLPLSVVEECMEVTANLINRSRGRNMVLVRDVMVPFVRLREIFCIPAQSAQSEHIAIVKTGNFRFGILVDEIIGNIQTVIKSLDKNFQHAEGYSGATILGDGTVALILDVKGLLKWAKDEQVKSVSGVRSIGIQGSSIRDTDDTESNGANPATE